jgi:hypothetical protein
MANMRETLKRHMPRPLAEAVIKARAALSAPPLEDIKLHDYALVRDDSDRPRLTLVIPSISPAQAFGGVTTGLDIFLALGAATGFDLRIMLDDFDDAPDRVLVDKRAAGLGLNPADIELLPRTADSPTVAVRARDVFFSYNWWITLNLNGLLQAQAETFGAAPPPLIYLMQEYEPAFYPFSSTHMLARLAFDSPMPCWGIFNSSQLHDYCVMQGHAVERSYVFEPRLADGLRPFVNETVAKKRQILVYGRPTIPRNCFSLIEKGLIAWAATGRAGGWDLVSAGIQHKPIDLGNGQQLRSLGKLSIDGYARLLQESAVGISLMSSPHPSYPPLEMAHFGVRTITNAFANKDLSSAHANILSLRDVRPAALADAIGRECDAFDADPDAGWARLDAASPFLTPGPFEYIPILARDLVDRLR